MIYRFLFRFLPSLFLFCLESWGVLGLGLAVAFAALAVPFGAGVWRAFWLARSAEGAGAKVAAAAPRVWPKLTTKEFARTPELGSLDYILVGGGVSGLWTALLLSLAGYRVAVVEASAVVGGGAHTWKLRKKWSTGLVRDYEFDTGFHYAGRVFSKFLPWFERVCGCGGERCALCSWQESDACFDRLVLDNGVRWCFRRDRVEQDLRAAFAHEREKLDKYWYCCREAVSSSRAWFVCKLVAAWSPWRCYPKSWSASICGSHVYWASRTVRQVLEEDCDIAASSILYRVLTGQYGNYGSCPDTASFFVHAAVVEHYKEGGFRPRRGPGEWARRLGSLAASRGALIYVRSAVARIVLPPAAGVPGVVLANGVELWAKRQVISSVGREVTRRLVAQKSAAVGEKAEGQVWHNHMFVALSPDVQPQPACRVHQASGAASEGRHHFNLWVHEKIGDLPSPLFVSCSSSSNNDDECVAGGAQLTVIHEAHDNLYSALVRGTDGPAGDAEPAWLSRAGAARLRSMDAWQRRLYGGAKLDLERQALALLRYLCQKRVLVDAAGGGAAGADLDQVCVVRVGTALTTRAYLGRFSSYGEACSPRRFADVEGEGFSLNQSTARHLVLTGQDVVTPGWAGALIAAVMSTVCALGPSGVLGLLLARPRLARILLLLK